MSAMREMEKMAKINCRAINVKARHKEHVNGMSVRLIQYYLDYGKRDRLQSGLCKYCAYIGTDRVGGAAITKCNCDYCGIEMTFGNTCTDCFCAKCAVEIKHCKHCGQKLD